MRLKISTKNKKGIVLVIVMSFMTLMALSTVSLSTMIQQDVKLIEISKEREQARFLAEAGINHALSKIKASGFSSRADFAGTLDAGSYNVSYSEIGGRHLITSTGILTGGKTEIVTVEVEDNTPTALNYFSGAGNNIEIYSLVTNAVINGDIHANNEVKLWSGPFFAWLYINGVVSAKQKIWEGWLYNDSGNRFFGDIDPWDNHVVINSFSNDSAVFPDIAENAKKITFPNFDYKKYKEAAEESGDYYNSSKTFNGAILQPANGIVYVSGNAVFLGNCEIHGGIIADKIYIGYKHSYGALKQISTNHNRNVIIARDGDIIVKGPLETEKALVYATESIKTDSDFADLTINGIMLAKGGDIIVWNYATTIFYNYVSMSPEDMLSQDNKDILRVISWNR